MTTNKISMVTLVNNVGTYHDDVIKSSSAFKDNIEYIPISFPKSAATGLNEGLEKASNELIICCHQDIYFFDNCYKSLMDNLNSLRSKNWGVCGIAGCTFEGKCIYNYKMMSENIVQAQTLDCSLLILKKSNNLKFDENLKLFHMYGEDICLQANDKGLGVYILNVPILHKSKWTAGPGLGESAAYVAKKWHHKFGKIRTTVGTYSHTKQ
jgi:hypothetical protein